MKSPFTDNERINFIEQVHQEFLYMKGYGTYAYISSHEVDVLFDAYRGQQQVISTSISRLSPEVDFIRSYIKSLGKSAGHDTAPAQEYAVDPYQDL